MNSVCGASVEYGPVGPVPARPLLDRRLGGGGHLVADRRSAVLTVPGTARFGVRDGGWVTVQAEPGTDPRAVDSLLLGTVVALLLAQRGQFALHASTVLVGAQGVAVAGAGRAGKSTAALALRRRGARLVTDDVSPVRDAGADPVEVEPFGRPLHVWPDTALAFGLDLTGSRPVLPATMKRSVPVGDAARATLDAVVLLRVDPDATAVRSRRLDRRPATAVLRASAYRGPALTGLWGPELFAWAAALARALAVWTVTRPAAGWSADEVADRVAAIAVGAAELRTAR